MDRHYLLLLFLDFLSADKNSNKNELKILIYFLSTDRNYHLLLFLEFLSADRNKRIESGANRTL